MPSGGSLKIQWTPVWKKYKNLAICPIIRKMNRSLLTLSRSCLFGGQKQVVQEDEEGVTRAGTLSRILPCSTLAQWPWGATAGCPRKPRRCLRWERVRWGAAPSHTSSVCPWMMLWRTAGKSGSNCGPPSSFKSQGGSCNPNFCVPFARREHCCGLPRSFHTIAAFPQQAEPRAGLPKSSWVVEDLISQKLGGQKEHGAPFGGSWDWAWCWPWLWLTPSDSGAMCLSFPCV